MPKGVYIRKEEDKNRLRKLGLGRHYQNSGMSGKHHSEDSRTKISIANSGENHWNYGNSTLCPFDKGQCDINIINDDFKGTTNGKCRHGEWDTSYQTAPCNIENYRKKKTTKPKPKRKPVKKVIKKIRSKK